MPPAIKHPYVGGYRVTWRNHGRVVECIVERDAKYKRGNLYSVLTPFATVRPVYGPACLYDDSKGWVVTRNAFEDVASFPTLDEAKVFVESLIALEN